MEMKMKLLLAMLLVCPVVMMPTSPTQRNVKVAANLLSRRAPRRSLPALISQARAHRGPSVGLQPPFEPGSVYTPAAESSTTHMPIAVGYVVGPPTYPPPWYRQPSPTQVPPCRYAVCDPGITHPLPQGYPIPLGAPKYEHPGVLADDFRHTQIKALGSLPTLAPELQPCPFDPAAPRPHYCPEPPPLPVVPVAVLTPAPGPAPGPAPVMAPALAPAPAPTETLSEYVARVALPTTTGTAQVGAPGAGLGPSPAIVARPPTGGNVRAPAAGPGAFPAI